MRPPANNSRPKICTFQPVIVDLALSRNISLCICYQSVRRVLIKYDYGAPKSSKERIGELGDHLQGGG